MNATDETGFYDERWRAAGFPNHLKMARASAIMEAISSRALEVPKIIDLGCGTGWLTNILATFGPTTGVDLSPEAVAHAREAFPRAQFEHVDFRNWTPTQADFDVVVSQEVLEHVEDQAAYLALARRLLRPGGYLVLTMPNKPTFEALPEATRDRWKPQPIEHWLSSSELRKLASEHFRVIKMSSIILCSGNGLIRRVLASKRLRSKQGIARLQEMSGLGLHLVMLAQAKDS